MDQALKVALVEYGRTILRDGWKAGEPIIQASRIKDFEKWARALGIMLRTHELLDGRVAK